MGDEWMDDEFADATPAAAPVTERRLIDEGTYEFEIVDTIDEADSLEVRLALDDRSFSWVFCRIQKGARFGKKLAHELRQALGIPPGGLMDAVAAGAVKGRRVQARVYQRQVGTRTYVNVGEFKATEKPAEPVAAKPARKSQAAKVIAHFPDDDIPF